MDKYILETKGEKNARCISILLTIFWVDIEY